MDAARIAPLPENLSLRLASLVSLECGLKKAFLECLCQSATVCFDEQGHSPGVSMQITGQNQTRYLIFWEAIDEEMRRTWADREEATEYGAYCIAFLLMHELRGMLSIERSKKENGFDYWIGTKDDGQYLFQKKAVLEVSGIRNGTVSSRTQRLNEKITRLRNYKSEVPAVVVVVEFGTPESAVAEIR